MPNIVSELQKTGYLHKKEEIDYAVARRITKLYKILQHRFQSDVKVWLSHIDFLKRMVSLVQLKLTATASTLMN